MENLPTDTGFAIGVAGFLVWWITKSLNGKLDRISDGLLRLADMLEKGSCPLNKTHDHAIIPLRDRDA